jgi:isopenicillin N synthase-like dioxygenase
MPFGSNLQLWDISYASTVSSTVGTEDPSLVTEGTCNQPSLGELRAYARRYRIIRVAQIFAGPTCGALNLLQPAIMPPVASIVPTIDLALWTSGRPESRAAVAASFDAAARDVGFAQVINHGISDSTIDKILDAADALYALPLSEKCRVAPPSPTLNRGYAASGTESIALSLASSASAPPPKPDMFEAFTVGNDNIDYSDPFYAAESHRLFAPNIWPDEPAKLRSAVNGYFCEAHRVALTMTDIFAPALGLPEGYFRPFVDRSTTTMRVINYEPVGNDCGKNETKGQPDSMRMGAHSDYGVVTVLYADAVPGLQVMSKSGVWVDVVPDAGALLINLGDMTAEWTNDRWRSTLHRVVPCADRRRSVAFFLDANYDKTIECLPSCTDSQNPPKYQPVNAGEHLMAKFLGPRTFTASKGVVDTSSGRLDN